MKIYFVINQDLFDGSAHALYCYRNCWWLATTAPAGHSVELIFPGENRWSRCDETQHAAEHFRLVESSLKVTALPAWRVDGLHRSSATAFAAARLRRMP